MARNATPTNTLPPFVTIRRACKRTGAPEHQLRAATRAGAVALYQPPGGHPLVNVAEVEAWLRSHRVAPTAHARARAAEVLAREERRAG